MNPTQRNPNIKIISPAEMQLRREKSLCYWCDEQFSLKHKCPVMMLQFDDGKEEVQPAIEHTKLDMLDPTPESTTEDHHLS
ncbi:hypothetical protein ABFV50_32945, partial [Bacillus cereus]